MRLWITPLALIKPRYIVSAYGKTKGEAGNRHKTNPHLSINFISVTKTVERTGQINRPNNLRSIPMTNTNTELEKRFQRYRHESIQPSEPEPYIHVGLHHACQFSDLISDIRTEKEKSYQEGVVAERAKNNRVLYALALMWNQYCGVKGHLYMMAGEAALEELQRAGLLGDNHEEIDYKKIDALLTPINTV